MSRSPQKTDPDLLVRVNGEEMRIADIPDGAVRAMFGYGHIGQTYGRKVVTRDGSSEWVWPYTIENCLYAGDMFATEWIEHGTTLVCVGCGLDCT